MAVPKNEQSGLHDIRKLARESMERTASRPPTGEMEIPSSAGLGHVALPRAGREVQTMSELTTSNRAVTQSETPAARRASRGTWVGASVIAVAVAVAGAYTFTRDGQAVDVSGPIAVVGEGADTDTDVTTRGAHAPTAEPIAAAEPEPAATDDTAEFPEAAPAGQATVTAGTVADEQPSATTDRKVADAARAVAGDKRAAVSRDTPAANPLATAKKKGDDKIAATAPAAPSGKSSMDDLLNEATGGDEPAAGASAAAAPAAAADAPKLPKKLSRQQVKAGMDSIVPRVQACYQEYQVAGKVLVKVIIDPTGKVTTATPGGDLGGTPTGACVADAVSKAKFDAWSGEPLNVSYPFVLQ